MEELTGPALVGRAVPFARLLAAMDADRPVAVVGEAGIGKTTLVRAAARERGRRLFEGGGFSTLRSHPYLALRRAVGAALDGDPSSVAAVVERIVGPEVIFVDDLQWVDRDSLAVLELLVGRSPVVIAVREGDVESSTALSVAAALRFEMIRLEPLDSAESQALVQRLPQRRHLPANTIDRIVARAGGNPLLLEELAVIGEVSASSTRMIESRLDRLPAESREVVELLAIADRPLPRSALTGDPAGAITAGLVVERDGSIEIRHALLAEAIRGRLETDRRVIVHARLAELVDDPAEVARHLAASGDRARAASTALTALDSTSGASERAALLVIAAEATEGAGVFRRRLEAAAALDRLADWASVIRILDPFDGQIDAPVSDDELALREALVAHAAYSLGRHDDARARLADARARVVTSGSMTAARLAWEVAAFMVNVDGSIPGALEYLDDVLGGQPADGSGFAELVALRESIALLAGQPIDIGLIRAGLDAAVADQSFARAADLAKVVTIALVVAAGHDAALDFLAEQIDRFEAVGASSVALDFLGEVVQLNVVAGRFHAALTAADELAERPSPPRARQAAAIFRNVALAALGHLDEAAAGLRDVESVVTDDWFGRGELLAAQAQVESWSGRPARAVELVETSNAIAAPIVDGHVLPGLTGAWACLELGMPIRALSASIRSLAGAEPECEGLGLLASNDGEPAAARFAEAARLWRGYQGVRMMTCHWAEGEALRQAGSSAAVATLTAALGEAEAAGFEPLAVRVRRSLRLAGVRLAATSGGVSIGRPHLTQRERELIDLVGQGLTNLEIARRMGLGRPTVSRILSNAMTKLDADSRAHAVALAMED